MARAITLVESRRADHRERAQELLVELLPHAGGARRVGISGVPGVGKSTFIDQLGVDADRGRARRWRCSPSTRRRRARAARSSATRPGWPGWRWTRTRSSGPSPTSGTLGGVAQATRESMVVVEAAGYDVVLVETVGVGQSEITVAEMVDSFLFLTLARTGDQLQGIKRGILEIADVIAVNKADGPGARRRPQGRARAGRGDPDAARAHGRRLGRAGADLRRAHRRGPGRGVGEAGRAPGPDEGLGGVRRAAPHPAGALDLAAGARRAGAPAAARTPACGPPSRTWRRRCWPAS